MTTSGDELSRQFSTLSTSSALSGKSDTVAVEGEEQYSDSNFDDSDKDDAKLSRQSTSMSTASTLSSRPSSSRPRGKKEGVAMEDDGDSSDNNFGDSEKDDAKLSRQSTSVSTISVTSSRPSSSRLRDQNDDVAKADDGQHTGNHFEDSDENHAKISRQSTSMSTTSTASSRPSSSRPSTKLSSAAPSREQTLTNETQDEKDSSNSSSDSYPTRENTNISVPSHYQTEASSRENSNISHRKSDMSREGTGGTSVNGYEDDFDADENSTRDHSFVSQSEEADDDNEKLEKENSVLIEKDGKFQLIDEKELTIDQRNILGLNKRPKQKPNSLAIPANERVRKSSNPEYDHVKSVYGMTEQQKEMKVRRTSVMQMRKQEEKERMKQEEEEQKVAAEKSYKKWLTDKKESKGDQKTTVKKKQPKISRAPKARVEEDHEDEEKRAASDKAFRAWLDEKQEQSKDEKRLEIVRLAEEAQNYVVRDRKQCDKAFREWLRKKKSDRSKEETNLQSIRKKSQHAPGASKKKSLAPLPAPPFDTSDVKKQQRRPRSSVRAAEVKKPENEKEVKRRPKTSKVRMADNFGYRHPASIDDFISRKW